MTRHDDQRGDDLLNVTGLDVVHTTKDSTSTILSGVDLRVGRGETVGIVGESGSGKSILSKAIVGLLPPGISVQSGDIRYDDTDMLSLSSRARARYRGKQMTLLYQDPFTTLNPLLRCGVHITEGLKLVSPTRVSHKSLRPEAVKRLAEVGIHDEAVADRYPFQLSGGMRQRVALASALAGDPNLLIADEPSTALDVTTQAEILDLLSRTQAARGMSLVLITHDLRVAFSVCDRVYVMYAGGVLEVGKASDLQRQPMHPYSHGLLLSEPSARRRQAELHSIEGNVPSPDSVHDQCAFAARCAWAMPECSASRPELIQIGTGGWSRCIRLDEIADEMRQEHRVVVQTELEAPSTEPTDPIVSVLDVGKTFHVGRNRSVDALRGVSMSIGRGESVGLVGESGSGKTTLGRCIGGLETPTSGSIQLFGRDGASVDPLERPARRIVQIVFQDPYSSLDPRQKIVSALTEPMIVNGVSGAAARTRAAELMDIVGLPTSYLDRRPTALSGGERQRIAIARALTVEPQLLVCDEPVSALDVSVQAQILKLFRELRDELGLSLLFITHDLAVVRQVVDSVHILHRGRVVESGPVDDVLDNPSDPYTRQLIASIPGEGEEMLAEAGVDASSVRPDPDLALSGESGDLS